MKTHLVLSGGGLDGFKSLGALKCFKEHGQLKNITHITGASVGSLLGLMLICNIDEATIRRLFVESHNEGVTAWNIKRLLFSCSLFEDNHYVKHTIKLLCSTFQLIYDLNELTFQTLYDRTGITYTVVVSNLTQAKSEYFNVHNNPNMDIEKAIIMSCAIPFVFPFVKHNDNVYVDGCLLDHFPIEYALKESPGSVLGINLCSEWTQPTDEFDVITYGQSLLNVFTTKHTKSLPKRDDVLCLRFKKSSLGQFFETLSDDFIQNSIDEGYSECDKFIKLLVVAVSTGKRTTTNYQK